MSGTPTISRRRAPAWRTRSRRSRTADPPSSLQATFAAPLAHSARSQARWTTSACSINCLHPSALGNDRGVCRFRAPPGFRRQNPICNSLYINKERFDVIVCGAGHAGGEMAINTDVTGIQFRLLNESKGPAVQSPRAQCDKKAYQFRIKHTLELQPNLTLFQATVTGLIYDKGMVVGCRTNLDIDFSGRCVVVTTGTFLRGLMHIGQIKNEGGRLGDFSSKTLSASLMEIGIELRRLKTGTPPRVLGRSIDF